MKKENAKKYKALQKPANKTNEKVNAVLDLIIIGKNVNNNNEDEVADSDQEIDNALNELSVLSNQDKDAEHELKQDNAKHLKKLPSPVPQSTPA